MSADRLRYEPYERISGLIARLMLENATPSQPLKRESSDQHEVNYQRYLIRAFLKAHPSSLLCMRFGIAASSEPKHLFFFGHAGNAYASIPVAAITERPRFTQQGLWDAWMTYGHGEVRPIREVIAELSTAHGCGRPDRNQVYIAFWEELSVPGSETKSLRANDVDASTTAAFKKIKFAARSFGQAERDADAKDELLPPVAGASEPETDTKYGDGPALPSSHSSTLLPRLSKPLPENRSEGKRARLQKQRRIQAVKTTAKHPLSARPHAPQVGTAVTTKTPPTPISLREFAVNPAAANRHISVIVTNADEKREAETPRSSPAGHLGSFNIEIVDRASKKRSRAKLDVGKVDCTADGDLTDKVGNDPADNSAAGEARPIKKLRPKLNSPTTLRRNDKRPNQAKSSDAKLHVTTSDAKFSNAGTKPTVKPTVKRREARQKRRLNAHAHSNSPRTR